jgi:hypothetical protein
VFFIHSSCFPFSVFQVQSARSKAHLLTAVHEFLDKEKTSTSPRSASSLKAPLLSYFPAYEIMMDDLRDYRFYATDMLHPSPLALDYIYTRFVDTYFDNSSASVRFKKEMEGLQRNLSHRPLDEASSAHQAFLKKQLKEMKQLQAEWPHLDFTDERLLIEKKLYSL